MQDIKTIKPSKEEYFNEIQRLLASKIVKDNPELAKIGINYFYPEKVIWQRVFKILNYDNKLNKLEELFFNQLDINGKTLTMILQNDNLSQLVYASKILPSDNEKKSYQKNLYEDLDNLLEDENYEEEEI